MDLRKQTEIDGHSAEVTEKFQVRDTFHVLVTSVLVVAAYAFSIMVLLKQESIVDLVVGGVFFAIVMGLLVSRARAVWDGIAVDLSGGVISFPGGGLEANAISDYFSPRFLLQYFQRIVIDLEDLQSIRKSRKWEKPKFSDKEVLVNLLELSGGFGDAYIKFESAQKCNQVYVNLTYHLQMGEPIVVR